MVRVVLVVGGLEEETGVEQEVGECAQMRATGKVEGFGQLISE